MGDSRGGSGVAVSVTCTQGSEAWGTNKRARAPTITVNPATVSLPHHGGRADCADHGDLAAQDDVDTGTSLTTSPPPRRLSPTTGTHETPRTTASWIATCPPPAGTAAAGAVGTSARHLLLEIPNNHLLLPSASPRTSSSGSSSEQPSALDFSINGTDMSTTATSFSALGSRTTSRTSLLGHDGTACDAGGGLCNGANCDDKDRIFAFSPDVLVDMIASKSLAEFQALGGLDGIVRGLRTDRKAGLSLDETAADNIAPVESVHSGLLDGPRMHRERHAVFGTNRLPDKKIKGIFQLMLIALNDKVLILLSVVATISLALGLYQAFGQPHGPGQPRVEWVDGVTIMAAVIIVVVAGALNDYQKEQQFARLTKKKDDRKVKAIRSGKSVEISVYDVLAGDILHLEPGDLVPVDGILVSGHNVRCDESSVTGESDQIVKIGGQEALEKLHSGRCLREADPFIISGSKVLEGLGTYVVTGVGVNSAHGRLRMGLEEPTEATPLQEKLSDVADKIAMAGVAMAVLLFVVLTIKFFSQLPYRQDSDFEKAQTFLRIFIVSITVVVIAVPEGLPLAVTLALAIAVTRMLKDNNLVRILSACETMGNATTVCSDKTGTLTMNEMRVTTGMVGIKGRFVDQRARFSIPNSTTPSLTVGSNSPTSETGPTPTGTSPSQYRDRAGSIGAATARFASSLSAEVRRLLVNSIAINSTAFLGEQDGKPAYIGSKTEAALLTFAAERLGMSSLQEERANADVIEIFPFDSNRKCMATVVKMSENLYRMYVKGAPEIVLEKSISILADPAQSMEEVKLNQERRVCVTDAVDSFASQSLRTLGLAYRDFSYWPPVAPGSPSTPGADEMFDKVFHDLTFMGVMGIQDPLRPGVEEAVALCQHAGVFVRMVTGDNAKTATAIAVASGILTEDGLVMEGPKFRALSATEMYNILPRLQVLARSSPDDKKLLVKRLKELGETVAVTGDGTNDGPALRAADVGFSMGISGTEVTKEASSIVLMDDNFSSIVKAIEWGRSVNDVIKKFLQFQLTVNITAVTLTFVSAIAGATEESILTPVQLLWVNLIMDTFAALALATDPANPSVLNRLPERRTAPLISFTSWKMITGQAIYQLSVTVVLNFAGCDLLGYTTLEEKEALKTIIFNTFVWMQFFNLCNNRRLDNKLNIFEGMLKNPFFIAINLIIIVGQVLIVCFGGEALSVAPLTATQWGISLFLGFLSIPVGVLIRLIPDNLLRRLLSWRLLMTRWTRRRAEGFYDTHDELSWSRAVDNVRCELMMLRQPRSSRLGRLRHEIFAFLQGKTRSEDSPDVEVSGPTERTPLLSPRIVSSRNSSTPSLHRSKSDSGVFGPAAVMAGMVAGSVAGWPSVTSKSS
ncbi:P-type calcium ATPase [Podospora didyma]|uniref:Calcium-transporting ATPase n=1 Tax=Podospora didyma TaxID=330526 RepID=A0AAE0K1Z2_9PEZI|nr:P-type calcium ATPase [Podospora didyma]